MIRQLVVLLCILMLSWSREVGAQTPVVIVVPHVSTTDYEHFEHRLRSELIAEGFQPVSVEVAVAITSQTLQRQAARLMSPAAIAIGINEKSVSGLVWIRGRDNGPDLLRPVPDYPLGEQAAVVFAVRATDILHGGLLELGYIGTTPEAPMEAWSASPQPINSTEGASRGAASRGAASGGAASSATSPAPPTSAATRENKTAAGSSMRPESPGTDDSDGSGRALSPPEAKRKREKSPKLWHVRGMASLRLPILKFPTSVGFEAAVMRRLQTAWSVGLTGSYGPTVRASAEQGRANVSQATVGARLELQQRPFEGLTAFEFVEAGLHVTLVTGDAAPNYVPYEARSYVGYSSLGLGATWSINGNVGLIAQSALVLPWKQADVIVVRTVVAEASGPTVALDLGLQLAF